MYVTRHRILNVHDVCSIPQDMLPAIVHTDSLRKFIGYKIKRHSNGYYNHVCWMIKPGVIASQDWTFRIVPAKKYLNKKHRMKIWVNEEWTPLQRELLLSDIHIQLGESWLKRSYDVLGIFGQFIRIRSINIPWLFYCSERVEKTLKIVEPNYPTTHSTPADLNAWMKQKERFRVYGVFDPDLVD